MTRCLVLALALLVSLPAFAFELREAYFEYKDFFPGSREPLIDLNGIENRQLSKELSLYLNTDVWGPLYFDNQIWSLVDERKDSGKPGQFRVVGWSFQVGFRPTPFLDIGYDHFSKHPLDEEYPESFGRFPVTDAFYARLYVYSAVDRRNLWDMLTK